jgi:hypothetical protein
VWGKWIDAEETASTFIRMATGLVTILNMVLGIVDACIARFQANHGIRLSVTFGLILGFSWVNAALLTCTPGPDGDMLTMVRISLRQ